jgi:hypothetical protein
MGTTLNGTTPQNTYPSLIKVGDNGAVDATLQRLSDGEGNDLPLEVSSTAVNFTGTVTQNGNPISTPPSGVSGAIQFTDGTNFASDAANLFWDDTNNRLGVGTNAPFEMMQIGSPTNRGTLNIVNDGISPYIRMGSTNSGNNQSTIIGDGNGALDFKYNGTTTLYLDFQRNVSINTARLALGAKLGVRGSGTTSATTALLVQNSAGTNLLTVRDDAVVSFFGNKSLSGSANASVFQILDNGAKHTIHANGVSSPKVLLRSGPSTSSLCQYVHNTITGTYIGRDEITPNASAVLDVGSTTQGFLPPRMTTTQKNAISSPAAGLVVYDTTLNKLCVYTTSWETITSL